MSVSDIFTQQELTMADSSKRSVFTVRLRDDLQDQLRGMAAEEGRFLGAVIERLLELGLAAEEASAAPAAKAKLRAKRK